MLLGLYAQEGKLLDGAEHVYHENDKAHVYTSLFLPWIYLGILRCVLLPITLEK